MPNRVQYFADYLTAIDAFCRWRSGEPGVPSYPELVRVLMGIPGEPPVLEPLLASTESALRAAGFRGALPDMISSFRSSREVPVDRVVETMEGYLAEARSWVVENLFPLPDDF